MQLSNSRKALFLVICWLYACIHLDRQILGVLADSIKSDLRLSDQQLGVLTGSAFSIVYALLGLYFGALADRGDRPSLVRTGAWIWSLSCIGGALAPGYPMLVAARGGVAVGEAVATGAAVSLIAELAGEKFRARAAGLFVTSAFIGGGVAAIAGGFIVELFLHSDTIAGWRAALIMAGLPGLAGAACLSGCIGREPMREPASQPPLSTAAAAVLALAALGMILIQMRSAPILSVPCCVLMALLIAADWMRRLRRNDAAAYYATFGQRRFRYLLLGFAAVTFVDYAAAFWLIPYTQRRFAMSTAAAGAQLGGLLIAGGIAGCALGGWLADCWRRFDSAGRVWSALVAVLAEGAAILLALGQHEHRAYLIAFGVFCLSSGAWSAIAAALAFDMVPRAHRGAGASMYFLLTTVLGPGLGPFVVGLGSDWLGSLGSALACACLVLGAAAAVLLKLGRLLGGPINQSA